MSKSQNPSAPSQPQTPAQTPAPAGDLATAAAVAAAKTDGAPPAAPAPAPAKAYPEFARVRSKFGDMVHMHTNTRITADEKKIPLDAFAISQIEAGKWEIVTD